MTLSVWMHVTLEPIAGTVVSVMRIKKGRPEGRPFCYCNRLDACLLHAYRGTMHVAALGTHVGVTTRRRL